MELGSGAVPFEFEGGLAGEVRVETHPREGGWKLAVRVENLSRLSPTATRPEALLRSMAGVHMVLEAVRGEFVSLVDPPPELREECARCRCLGLFPVLAGSTRLLLASPIILYDHPRVAPETPSPLYDMAETEELLRLSTMALGEGERLDAVRTSPRAAEAAGSALDGRSLRRLHGAFRPGDRVRLRPSPGRDVMDLALDGEAATVACVEVDLEDRVHVAVCLECDPGRDLPGHRFYFSPDELDRL
ncbi:MAG: hypothetical protein AB1758_03225 [Candidatus Eremiobacterota bacterium]